MTISNIGSSSSDAINPKGRPFEARKQQIDAIGTALQSGDVRGALDALDALRRQPAPQVLLAPRDRSGSNTPNVATDPLSEALDSIASALDKNELEKARKAFSAVPNDVRNGRVRPAPQRPQVSVAAGDDEETGVVAPLLPTNIDIGAVIDLEG